MILENYTTTKGEVLIISPKIGSHETGDICVHRNNHNICTGCDLCGLDDALQHGADFHDFFFKDDYCGFNIPKGCKILNVTPTTLVLGYEQKIIILKTFFECGANHMYRVSCHTEWQQIQEIKENECEPINVGYVDDAQITSYGNDLQHINIIDGEEYDFQGSVEDAVQDTLEHHDKNRKKSWLEETIQRFSIQIDHEEFDWEECYGCDI